MQQRRGKLLIILAILLILIGGFLWLATLELPVASQTVEKPLDSARFLKTPSAPVSAPPPVASPGGPAPTPPPLSEGR